MNRERKVEVLSEVVHYLISMGEVPDASDMCGEFDGCHEDLTEKEYLSLLKEHGADIGRIAFEAVQLVERLTEEVVPR